MLKAFKKGNDANSSPLKAKPFTTMKTQSLLAFASIASISCTSLSISAPALAQASGQFNQVTPDSLAIKRALNLARDTGIRLNGGLSKYRPARCMFDSISKNRCLAQVNTSGIIFHFPGGPPGWQESGKQPTLVTVLLISPDGRSLRQQIYNGPLTQFTGR